MRVEQEEKQKLEAETRRKIEEEQRIAAEEARRKEEERLRAEEEAKQKAAAGGIEMVDIPGGSFQMGDTTGTGGGDEKPVHTVNIKPFRMSKYEVTIAQYRWFAAATGRAAGGDCWVDASGQWQQKNDANWQNPYFNQSDNHPVVCVNWNDAVAFAQWLSTQTGQRYRLSSEAEWEYACRSGGRQEKYCGGNKPVALAWYDNDSGGKTHPVGQKSANGLGLYDMSGNVWEWTQDCWNESYNGAPADGSAWQTDYCGRRVRRGGSWGSKPGGLRSALRFGSPAADYLNTLGFRLVQDK